MYVLRTVSRANGYTEYIGWRAIQSVQSPAYETRWGGTFSELPDDSSQKIWVSLFETNPI